MQGGRTKKAIINIGVNFVNQIVSLVLAFISRTVFIRMLGIEYLGINGLFSIRCVYYTSASICDKC